LCPSKRGAEWESCECSSAQHHEESLNERLAIEKQISEFNCEPLNVEGWLPDGNKSPVTLREFGAELAAPVAGPGRPGVFYTLARCPPMPPVARRGMQSA
jgi:hypothetical protein